MLGCCVALTGVKNLLDAEGGVSTRSCFGISRLLLSALLIIHVVADAADPSKSRTSFLSLHHIQQLGSLANASRLKLKQVPGTFIRNKNFPEQADTYFQGWRRLNKSRVVLKSEKLFGLYMNSISTVQVMTELNDPFVSRVSPIASTLRKIIDSAANGTIQPGDIFSWVGGLISAFTLGQSKVYVWTTSCNRIELRNEDGTVANRSTFEFVRNNEPFKRFLLSMGSANSPILCGGSGIIFDGHGDKSQPFWLIGTSASRRKKTETVGTLSRQELSSGNEVVPLTEHQIAHLERLSDQSFGVYSAGTNTVLGEAQERASRGYEQYNNIAFLILSVAAILSSAAVAGISPGPGFKRNMIVAVEASVVYCFLGIVSHACVVLTRPNTFLTEMTLTTNGNFTYEGSVVRTYSESFVIAAGERMLIPTFLVITEVVAVLAAGAVTITLVYNIRQARRRRKKPQIDPYTLYGCQHGQPEEYTF